MIPLSLEVFRFDSTLTLLVGVQLSGKGIGGLVMKWLQQQYGCWAGFLSVPQQMTLQGIGLLERQHIF